MKSSTSELLQFVIYLNSPTRNDPPLSAYLDHDSHGNDCFYTLIQRNNTVSNYNYDVLTQYLYYIAKYSNVIYCLTWQTLIDISCCSRVTAKQSSLVHFYQECFTSSAYRQPLAVHQSKFHMFYDR